MIGSRGGSGGCGRFGSWLRNFSRHGEYIRPTVGSQEFFAAFDVGADQPKSRRAESAWPVVLRRRGRPRARGTAVDSLPARRRLPRSATACTGATSARSPPATLVLGAPPQESELRQHRDPAGGRRPRRRRRPRRHRRSDATLAGCFPDVSLRSHRQPRLLRGPVQRDPGDGAGPGARGAGRCPPRRRRHSPGGVAPVRSRP